MVFEGFPISPGLIAHYDHVTRDFVPLHNDECRSIQSQNRDGADRAYLLAVIRHLVRIAERDIAGVSIALLAADIG